MLKDGSKIIQICYSPKSMLLNNISEKSHISLITYQRNRAPKNSMTAKEISVAKEKTGLTLEKRAYNRHLGPPQPTQLEGKRVGG